MSAAARVLATITGLGALAGAVDGGVRGMSPAAVAAAAGWAGLLTGTAAGVAWAAAAGLRRAWPSAEDGLSSARAWLWVAALGVWAAGLCTLADRFAVRFSAIDLRALLWAGIGLVGGVGLGLWIEPVARRLAPRWPAADIAPPRALALAAALVSAIVIAFAIGHAPPTDPHALGALAARWLRG